MFYALTAFLALAFGYFVGIVFNRLPPHGDRNPTEDDIEDLSRIKNGESICGQCKGKPYFFDGSTCKKKTRAVCDGQSPWYYYSLTRIKNASGKCKDFEPSPQAKMWMTFKKAGDIADELERQMKIDEEAFLRAAEEEKQNVTN